jgi:hypothetical protein
MCPLDPEKGQVAFSQPTGSGQAVIDACQWGKVSVSTKTESVQTIQVIASRIYNRFLVAMT